MNRNQETRQAKVFFVRLIIMIMALTVTFVILNFVLYRNNEFFYHQLILMVIYLVVTSYLFLRLFMIFRIFIRNEVLLEESNKHMQELKLFTNNLIKQRREIQRMLNETTELSNKLLEQNLKLHTAQEAISQEKEKFATLFQASQLIASSWDLEQVLPRILELANKLVRFQKGRILIPEGDYLVITYSYGYDMNKNGNSKVNIGQGITGLAALNREIIIVDDVINDPRYIKEFEDTRAEIAVPLIYQGELLGILDILDDKPFAWLEYPEDIFDILVLFGNYAAMLLYNSSIYTELKNSYVNIIKVLAKAIDAKDTYTHGHCERVKEISLQIGRKLELDPKDMEELEFAAFLHDIGKIGLPNALYKPGD